MKIQYNYNFSFSTFPEITKSLIALDLSRSELPEISEMTVEEFAVHKFIEKNLSGEEISSIVHACDNPQDEIPSCLYFALGKKEYQTKILDILKEVVEGKLTIGGFIKDIPSFEFVFTD